MQQQQRKRKFNMINTTHVYAQPIIGNITSLGNLVEFSDGTVITTNELNTVTHFRSKEMFLDGFKTMESFMKLVEVREDLDCYTLLRNGEKVAEMVRLASGVTVTRWCTDVNSTAIFASYEDALTIHSKTPTEFIKQ